MSAEVPCPVCGLPLRVVAEIDPETQEVSAVVEPHEDCEPPTDVEVSRITITRVIGDAGDEVQVTASDDLAVIEGAGMLTMALDTWMRTNGFRDAE